MPGNTPSQAELESQFIDAVKEALNEGYGLIPLAGAGLSAPSGVPIIHEIARYLHRCIAMTLGLDHELSWGPDYPEGSFDFEQRYRWLPGRDEWPPFGDPQIYKRETVNWVTRLNEVLEEQNVRRRTVREFDFSESAVFQEAHGAMAEWRTSLLFFVATSLHSGPRGTIPPDLVLNRQ